MSESKIIDILPLVQKPSRYVGRELNSCIKDPSGVKLRVCLCFPDTYEVGISHLGLKILYEALNRMPDVYAERAYAPWPDMEAALRKEGLLLASLETMTGLGGFDVVGFTLQYELSYTNVLGMMELGGIPVLAKDRSDSDPLVIAGGPCAVNPEPLAGFIDLFVIGDAEEAVTEIADSLIRMKTAGGAASKKDALLELSKIEGVYVPSHFEVTKKPDGSIAAVKNIAGGPDKVRKRTLDSLDGAVYPREPIVPFAPAVHNRVTVEVARGCTRGCRFCQAGYIYRPNRERSPDEAASIARKSIESSGYEELSLSSLSTGDYTQLLPLMKNLMDEYEGSRVSVSLPSLRVGTLTQDMCTQIRRVRKTGFTIAPEAGTQRLRDVINKDVTEAAFIETVRTVFSEGWDTLKLYFMTGLPTETDEDIRGIIDLCRKALDVARKSGGRKKKKINVGVSAFVPKPHTPFQWTGQEPFESLMRKKGMLSETLGRKPFSLKSGLLEMSVLEAAFARGGREIGAALSGAYRAGARFDGWSERFDFSIWEDAFRDVGLDVREAATRDYGHEEVLPWDHIDIGISKKFFLKELQKAHEGRLTPSCRIKCAGCGLRCEKEGLRDAPPPSHAPIRTEAARPEPGPSARIRIRYTKLEPLNILSHTEMMSLFFRAIARAGLPIRFSQGFNPHPRVSFGPALGVGIRSYFELLDIELSYGLNLSEVVRLLNNALPDGIQVVEAWVVGPKDPPAGVGLTRHTYEAEPPGLSDEETAGRLEGFMAKDSAVITRTGPKESKQIDVRPMVADAVYDTGIKRVRFTLVEHEGRMAKPFEVVAELFGMTFDEARSVRVWRIAMV